MSGLCEWDPARNQPAEATMRRGKFASYRGCDEVATLSVGTGAGNWHLCESCAALPRFKRYRRRVPLKGRGA